MIRRVYTWHEGWTSEQSLSVLGSATSAKPGDSQADLIAVVPGRFGVTGSAREGASTPAPGPLNLRVVVGTANPPPGR
jgi:hypothetical protein